MTTTTSSNIYLNILSLANASPLKYAGVVLTSLMLHYATERCIRAILYKLVPGMKSGLQAQRKETIFFGFLMGLFVTILSTPSCTSAAHQAWTSNPHAPWQFTTQAHFCMLARTTLWLSELRTLHTYPSLMLHHAVALLALATWIARRWSNVVFLTIYATLGSEVGGDMIYLVSAYRDTFPSHRLKDITKTNADTKANKKADAVPLWVLNFRTTLIRVDPWAYALIRGGGIIAVVWKLIIDPHEFSPPGIGERVFGYLLLGAYAGWCARYVVGYLRKVPYSNEGEGGKGKGVKSG